MSDKTWVEMCGEIDAWMNGVTRRLDILWQAHKQAQLERGMEETVFSANTELAQALADLHVENATLTADNAALRAKNEALEARFRGPGPLGYHDVHEFYKDDADA